MCMFLLFVEYEWNKIFLAEDVELNIAFSFSFESTAFNAVIKGTSVFS